MIIEGLVTCAQAAGSGAATPHVAALGPVVDPELKEWTLRPFQSSRIFNLLRSQDTCVFHVIDDPLPVVQLVLGQPIDVSFEELAPGCWIIREACSWYQLQIDTWNIDQARSEARAHVIRHATQRNFWGWNRAKHALLEAAILISRAAILPPAEIIPQIIALQSPIEKTAGPRELAAWHLVQQWLDGFTSPGAAGGGRS